MKLENQVVSLDLAKNLKELGVKQESYFSWAEYTDEDGHQVVGIVTNPGTYSADYYSAFTVAELGEMLPTKNENWQTSKAYNDKWFIVDYKNSIKPMYADTEADARAKMLIYLLENKLITL